MSGYLDMDIEVFHLRPLMLVELSWEGKNHKAYFVTEW